MFSILKIATSCFYFYFIAKIWTGRIINELSESSSEFNKQPETVGKNSGEYWSAPGMFRFSYQVLAITPGSCHSFRFRLSYQVLVILPGSGYPTRFRSSYQVQVILPGSGHSTRFRSFYQIPVILQGSGHSTRFRSFYQIPVILQGSGHPTRFKLPSSLFIIFLF